MIGLVRDTLKDSCIFWYSIENREVLLYFIRLQALYGWIVLLVGINFDRLEIQFYRWELYLERSERAAWKRTISYHVYFYTFYQSRLVSTTAEH